MTKDIDARYFVPMALNKREIHLPYYSTGACAQVLIAAFVAQWAADVPSARWQLNSTLCGQWQKMQKFLS